MTGAERVRCAILGKAVDRQPIYGWVSENLRDEITEAYGSVEAFEDHYAFDAAHLFGGPRAYYKETVRRLREMHEELTPDILLSCDDFFTSPRFPEDYRRLADRLAYHKAKGRFCYVQTPGFFEHFNGVFGIENHLMYLVLYPEELTELYRRQAEWTVEYAGRCIDLGMDMIHLSDDWGSQRDMLFSPSIWRELIYPNLKRVIDYVHSRGAFVSLHSDGCIGKVCDELAELGIDVLHPWQESAGMSYDLYLSQYADRFAILGGVCVQTALGILPRERLEEEIRRVFALLRGKRWICCTTHFVQKHCSIDDLTFAYDLIYRLARENP